MVWLEVEGQCSDTLRIKELEYECICLCLNRYKHIHNYM